MQYKEINNKLYKHCNGPINDRINKADYWTTKNNLIFCCNGHSVNIYRLDKNNNYTEVDFISIGDFAKDSATKEEFNNSVNDYINYMEED